MSAERTAAPPQPALAGRTRPARSPTTCCARSPSATPTPTSPCPRCCASGGLTGRDAAFATELTYGTLRGRGTLRRRAGRLRGPAAGRSSTRRCSTCCGIGAHQLLATRVPPHAAVASTVALARAGADQRAGRLRQRGAAPGRRARPRRLAGRRSRPTPSGRPRRSPGGGHQPSRRGWCGRCATRCTPMAARRTSWSSCSPPTTPRPQVTLVARPGRAEPRRAGRRRGACPAGGRPTPPRCPAGDPAGVPAVADRPGRRAGRGQPAGRARAARRARRGARPAVARPVRRPGRQGRAAGRAGGAGGRRADRGRAGRAPGRAGAPGPGRRRGRVAGRGRRRPRGRRRRRGRRPGALRPGAGRRARAPAWARCAAGRRPAGAASPPTWRRWAGSSAELLGRRARRGPPRRGGRLRDLLPARRRDPGRRRGRVPAPGRRRGARRRRRRCGRWRRTCRSGRAPTRSCGRTGTAPTRCSWPCCAADSRR